MQPPVELKTANGYDLQFGTNVLGHYFFTTLLLPTLIHTAKTSPLVRKAATVYSELRLCLRYVLDGHARVINTSSSAAYMVPKSGIVWEILGTDAASDAARTKLGPVPLYWQSKLVSNVQASHVMPDSSHDSGERIVFK